MEINFNNRSFRSQANAESGEVTVDTIFHYHQEGNIIWADYSGGQIVKGFLVGIIVKDQLELCYQHVNKQREIMTGKCKSNPELLENGKLKLHESWQWTCKDYSKGTSILIEI